ncbi:uncharacterized protein LOC123009130 [Tribolium madens]|uniref:uncharacterized protein LOC123009130 n=1 Tax=Tribolium madens TaxID=41895 RepID=UPI001CF71E5C|nr:uncharacterized protein LOC123009130 [Tribolium madens]
MEDSEITTVIQKCVIKTNANESEFSSPQFLQTTPSESLLCAAKCVLESLEIVDSDGNIIMDSLKEYIRPLFTSAREAIVTCGDEIKTVTTCDDMEKYRKCIMPLMKNSS